MNEQHAVSNEQLINIAIPNTTREKMAAIVELSKAIEKVASALVSVQVDVTVSNNHISNADSGVNIHFDDKTESEKLRRRQ